MSFYKVEKTVYAHVEFECESCGYENSFDQEIKLSADSKTKIAATDKLNGLVRKIGSGETMSYFKMVPCSRCGYKQSWMVQSAKTKFGLGVSVVAAIIMMVVFAAFLPNDNEAWAFCLGPIAGILIGLGAAKLYNPNGGFTASGESRKPKIILKS